MMEGRAKVVGRQEVQLDGMQETLRVGASLTEMLSSKHTNTNTAQTHRDAAGRGLSKLRLWAVLSMRCPTPRHALRCSV